VSYVWDAANQLVSVTDNRLGGMTTTAYTATGRPATLSQPNGVGVTHQYDSLDRVLSMAWKKGPAPAIESWAYTYNPRGQRLSSTDMAGRAARYVYDAASRLTSEVVSGDPSGSGTVTYDLDPTGNRLSRTSTLAALGAQTFSYDGNDQLTDDGYDPNGNTTQSTGHAYAYDFENRLLSRYGGAVSVVYDGDGTRVAKTVAGTTTSYLTGYDAHGNIAFLTDATGAETDTYAYDAWGNLVGRSGSTPNTRLYDEKSSTATSASSTCGRAST